MVHVWSINSGERFQGHHGPLVMFEIVGITRCGQMCFHLGVEDVLVEFRTHIIRKMFVGSCMPSHTTFNNQNK